MKRIFLSLIKISFITLSIAISFIVSEIITRNLFGNPEEVNGRNLRVDPNFGYKVNQNLMDVDIFGFRNPDRQRSGFRLAAIGDSHTYGYNVISEDSWPAQLSKLADIKTYNFGIGGNGVYSYHYLISEQLKDNKLVILGLYMPNDFSGYGYICDIDFTNTYWRNEVVRLNLSPPICENPTIDHTFGKRLKVSIIRLTDRSTFLTLLKREIAAQMKRFSDDTVTLTDKINPVSFSHLQSVSLATDTSHWETNTIYNDFLRMIMDWKNHSDEGQISIMLIPSSQAIVHRMIERDVINISLEKKKILDAHTKNEIQLEEKLLLELGSIGIPVKSASEELIKSFQQNSKGVDAEKFYPDSHPGSIGYAAYARVANELLKSMILTENTSEAGLDK
ncbi:hypothetical protein OAI58_09590 [Amylibacter sp.]|nr:hypothetical protein [Amylibacter sp.]